LSIKEASSKYRLHPPWWFGKAIPIAKSFSMANPFLSRRSARRRRIAYTPAAPSELAKWLLQLECVAAAWSTELGGRRALCPWCELADETQQKLIEPEP